MYASAYRKRLSVALLFAPLFSGLAAPLSEILGPVLPRAIVASAHAAEAGTKLYRYRNAEGRVEISNAVPASRARFGYEVLDAASGRVIERVAPELSGAALERKLAEDRAYADCEQQLARIRALYSSVDELEAARAKTLSALDSRIAHLENSRVRAEARLQSLRAEAAQMERSGRAVTAELKATMGALEAEIRELAVETVERRADQTAADARFDADHALQLAGTCDQPVD